MLTNNNVSKVSAIVAALMVSSVAMAQVPARVEGRPEVRPSEVRVEPSRARIEGVAGKRLESVKAIDSLGKASGVGVGSAAAGSAARVIAPKHSVEAKISVVDATAPKGDLTSRTGAVAEVKSSNYAEASAKDLKKALAQVKRGLGSKALADLSQGARVFSADVAESNINAAGILGGRVLKGTLSVEAANALVHNQRVGSEVLETSLYTDSMHRKACVEMEGEVLGRLARITDLEGVAKGDLEAAGRRLVELEKAEYGKKDEAAACLSAVDRFNALSGKGNNGKDGGCTLVARRAYEAVQKHCSRTAAIN